MPILNGKRQSIVDKGVIYTSNLKTMPKSIIKIKRYYIWNFLDAFPGTLTSRTLPDVAEPR